MERRLACILAADVVGYSRLMEADEEATLAALNAHRRFIDDRIADHRGRVFGSAGDSVIAEFASPVEAVRCAVEIQRELETRNAELSEDRRMQFRVGINLGDVVAEGENLHGDGVNIAARLEQLADPGGVCISGTVYDHLAGKLDLVLDDLGERLLKNISRQVRVWRWSSEGAPSSPSHGVAPPLAEKPSIAVLPFDNLSGDPEQEYFSDGLTEDVITALALARSFPVIARNSTFAYKGKSPDVRTLASDLGARYVLEGSVRKSGERLRITAQLIDAATGLHLWAEKFDRRLTDIFDLQDEIVQRITATVEPELERAEQKRSLAKKPQNLDAWDYYQRGMSCLYEFTKAGNQRAREMFERAIARDPEYSQAFSGVAHSHHRDLVMQYTDTRETSIAKCLEAARRGVTLDPMSSFAHAVLALAHVWPDQHKLAIAEAEKALELNPNNAQAYAVLGAMLDSIGNSEDGIGKLKKGLQLNPQDPRNHSYFTLLARANLNARRYEEAIAWARKALLHRPGYPNANYILAASLGHLGRRAEARAALEECERVQPGFVANRRDWRPYSDPSDNEHILEGVRKAGPVE